MIDVNRLEEIEQRFNDDYYVLFQTGKTDMRWLLDQLTHIHSVGYGGLYADELVKAGHRPWMHNYSDPKGCWCHRRIVFDASAVE